MGEMTEARGREVDRALLRENLKLSSEQRAVELMATLRAEEAFQRAGRARRGER